MQVSIFPKICVGAAICLLGACGGAGSGVANDPFAFSDSLPRADESSPSAPGEFEFVEPGFVEEPDYLFDEPTPFPALAELQQRGDEFEAADARGAYSGDVMRVFSAPTGDARFEGVYFVTTTEALETSEVGDATLGQLELVLPFGDGEIGTISGGAHSFIYLPTGATVLGNPDGAFPVNGEVAFSGSLIGLSGDPSAEVAVDLRSTGFVELPLGESDPDPLRVSMDADYRVVLLNEGLIATTVSPLTAPEAPGIPVTAFGIAHRPVD